MNRRQHKKVYCQVTYRGISLSVKFRVKPRERKAIKEWLLTCLIKIAFERHRQIDALLYGDTSVEPGSFSGFQGRPMQKLCDIVDPTPNSLQ